MERKLNQQELRYMAVVEPVAGTRITHCIERENRITFIVDKGRLGKAIGKQAKNIKLGSN